MSNDDRSTLPPRRATSAALLSLLGAGIGHVYAGRGRRGALLLALSFAWAPLTFALSFAAPATWVLFALVGVFFFTVLVMGAALVGSALAARRADRPYARRAYNHLGLYLGLAALNVLWFFGSAWLLREQAFEAYRIPTRSMSPGVQRDDRILVSKRLRPLGRGDLIVFAASDPPGATYFKRVIGLAGETVELKNGRVHVDGRPLSGERRDVERAGDRSYPIVPAGTAMAHGPVRVPAGHVYVLGDHRGNSRDSRAFGPIPTSAVRGIAQYIFWPGSRAGLLR